MKNILKIYKRDLKKIFTNSMAIILAVGIAVLPSLYAWFNIFNNRFSKISTNKNKHKKKFINALGNTNNFRINSIIRCND